jgi:hypothetical protein
LELASRGSALVLLRRKAKYGGMDVPEAKLLKHVEEENAKLKKLLAEHMLDAAALLPLSSAKASRICRPLWACRNGGPVR